MYSAFPFTDGRGRGGNAKAVIAEGVWSMNLQRCTATVIGSPIPPEQRLFFRIAERGNVAKIKLIYFRVRPLIDMSFLGIGGHNAGGQPSGVNVDRIEMAITECVLSYNFGLTSLIQRLLKT